jgi:hypothetical protein
MGAIQAGALGASLPVIDTVEPVSGVLIGTFVFGEPLAATPAGLGLQVIGAVAAVSGIALLGAAAPAAKPGRPRRPKAIVSKGHRAESAKAAVATGDVTLTAATGGDVPAGARR